MDDEIYAELSKLRDATVGSYVLYENGECFCKMWVGNQANPKVSVVSDQYRSSKEAVGEARLMLYKELRRHIELCQHVVGVIEGRNG